MNTPDKPADTPVTVSHGSREYLQLLRTLKAERRGLMLVLGHTQAERRKLATTIADNLGRRLHRDRASAAGKYIGETEKNLSSVLARTSSVDVVLLLDEGDALFGKRTEVKDSHDRYANIEVSYLVQRVEAHPGLSLLGASGDLELPEAVRRLVVGIVGPEDTDVSSRA